MNRQVSLCANDISSANEQTSLEKRLHIHVMADLNNQPNNPIHYSFQESLFGNLLIASTALGICYAAFYDNQNEGLEMFYSYFEGFTIQPKEEPIHKEALLFFQKEENKWPFLSLHLRGTAFQVQVWEALLTIPLGKLSSYSAMANAIGKPNAARAVGTAIGKNPIAFIIPCHRVVQTNGQLGGYMWGIERKKAILNWELNK